MASSLLSDAVTFALRVAIGRAVQQHVPAFSIHGPIAAPALNRVLDAAVRDLIDKAVSVLIDRAVRVLHMAFWDVFLAVGVLIDKAVASCVVAAPATIVVYLHRAWASRSRERRLAVLTFVSLSLLTVAVVLMVVLFLAIVDGGGLRSEDI